MDPRYESVARRAALVERGAAGFPGGLLRLPPALVPERLTVAGALPEGCGVAIVGTRSPDPGGVLLARRLAAECAARGAWVVSGGAAGIDRAAHEACAESGGRTLVVLPGGIDRPHPCAFEGFFAAIVEEHGGCLVTDQPPAQAPFPSAFLHRNRLIAALSSCVVVVQARVRSGALSTAAWAARCGVPVWAAAGSPLNPLHGGTNRLVAEGRARLLWSVDAFLGKEGREAGTRRREGGGLTGPQARIMRLLRGDPASVEELASLTGMEARRVAAIVFDLEMAGAVRQAAPGRYLAWEGGKM